MACIFLNHSPPGLQAHSRTSSHLWVCALVSEGKEGVRMHMHPQWCGSQRTTFGSCVSFHSGSKDFTQVAGTD